MVVDVDEWTSLLDVTFSQVKRYELDATGHLLGDTMVLSDIQWQQPSLLPGWTRAHVATHLARQAKGLTQSIRAAREGRHVTYDSQQMFDLDRGSERAGIDLQIDLDVTAGALTDEVNDIPPENMGLRVELRPGWRLPVALIPLLRLHELVIHHHDLDMGYTVESLEPQAASWLLRWTMALIGQRRDYPPLLVRSGSIERRLGGPGSPTLVSGSDHALYGWLTGRGYAAQVAGSTGIELPLSG